MLISAVAAMLHIDLLGTFNLRYGDAPVTDLNTERLQSLLAFLVLHRGVAQSRQHIAYTFWPDSRERQALGNLRNLLHRLRHALPDADTFLEVDARTLCWRADAPFTLDVADFEQRLAQARDAVQRADTHTARQRLAGAVACYRGELLAGFYDAWILPERERLHEQCTQALEQLVQLLETGRAYADALHHARRLLQLDPLREPTYRLLMRLHALNDDRAGALRVYQDCVAVLARELELEPAAATQALYEQLSGAHDATPAAGAPPETPAREIPLVGRRAAWKTLVDRWRTAAGGRAHLVTINGEAGIGKTRLAEELIAWAERQRIGTARTRSYAAEGHLAYAPVTDWLRAGAVRPHLATLDDAWRAELARLLPDLRTDVHAVPAREPFTESWQRQHLFEALARGILAGGRPLLLLFDDLQWSDRDSLEWLRFLLRFGASAPLLVVGTVRSEEVDPDHPLRALVLDLGRTGQVTEITLPPLDDADTARLAQAVAGTTLDADQAVRLYRETEGNPLFVVESVRAGLPAPGEAPKPERPGAPPPPSLPPTVHAVIAKRLAQLSPDARSLAGLAATIGRAFTFDVLVRASPLEEAAAMEALDELWQRRIVREYGATAYDFTHDKLREVAYADVSPVRRRLLHRRVAEALEAVHARDPGGVSAQIAAHYDGAGDVDRAIACYQRAAQVAHHFGANEDVVRLLTRALELLDQLPTDRERDERELALQTALGPALVFLKSYSDPEVIRVYERARALCDRLGRPCSAPILRGLAFAHGVAGDPHRQHEMGEALLALAQETEDPMLLVEAHYVVGDSYFWMGRFADSRASFEQALRHYRSDQHQAHVALYAQDPKVALLSRLGWSLWYLGYPDQAVEHSRAGLALARELAHPNSLVHALNFGAQLAINLRDVEGVHALSQELLAYAGEQAFPLWTLAARIWLGWVQVRRGAAEAGVEAIHTNRDAQDAMGVGLQLPFCLALLAEGYLAAGAIAEGLETTRRALATAERTGDRFHEAELHRLEGELLLQAGREEDAGHALETAIQTARRQQARALELRATASLGRLLHRQGRAAEARERLHAVCSKYTEGFDTPDLRDARALLDAWDG